MKKLITILLALVLVLSLAACGSGDKTDNRINIPESSTDLKGKDYKDVMTLLQVAGFTNIEVEVLDDLITGWLTKDGEVEKVSINGDTDYSASSKHPYDAKIVITYHTFPSTETEKVPEATEASGVSGGRNVSGFDTKTNQTITWCGIDFSIPSYYDVLDERSTKTKISYYPEEEDYYASIIFQSQEFSGTQEYFNSQIPSIVESTLDGDFFANTELQKSEKISIAGLPGWTIIFSRSDTDGDGVSSTGSYSFVYNINTGKIIMITCAYDSNDKSQYDYIGDYKKALETAKLLVGPIQKTEDEILTIKNNEDLARLFTKGGDEDLCKEFVAKYKGRTIEFDGNIALVSPLGNYKTRYDFLIYAGDYSEVTSNGSPAMQFRDKNYYDLNLTGDNIPDTIRAGDNFHIIAEVEDLVSGYLVILKPISTEKR